MNRRALLSLLVAGAAGCTADRIPVAPAVVVDPGVFFLPGNPPPPFLSGAVGAVLVVGGGPAPARVPGIAPLHNVAPSATFEHRFAIMPVVYDANAQQTVYWMNFPPQQRPPKAFRIGPITRGRITQEPEGTFARGRIFDFDAENNGFWVIDLTQFNQPAGVPAFGPCLRPNLPCVTLPTPIVATFYQIVGTDPQGNYLFQLFTSDPAQLSFIDPADL